MARAEIIGKDAARAAAMASIAEAERKFALNLDALVRDIDDHIKALTPVNTGQAVRNYIWSVGQPNSVVYEAIDNGPPGPTNSMTLGSEPRRGPNEAAAARSLGTLGIAANPFAVIYLTNLSPDIEGLELGLLPGPPLRSRSPSGMFGITAAYFNSLIASKGMLR